MKKDLKVHASNHAKLIWPNDPEYRAKKRVKKILEFTLKSFKLRLKGSISQGWIKLNHLLDVKDLLHKIESVVQSLIFKVAFSMKSEAITSSNI